MKTSGHLLVQGGSKVPDHVPRSACSAIGNNGLFLNIFLSMVKVGNISTGWQATSES